MFYELEGNETGIAINALRVAAEVYAKDAATCKGAGDKRTAEHFELQAKEAIALADKIEEDR